MDGWIKLHRKILEKPIWKKSTKEQRIILICLILMASHTEKEWEWEGKKFKVTPGQFITSLNSIAEISGCSTQNVRSALTRFKKFEFLTYQVTKTGRLITIINWELYQGGDDKPNIAPNKEVTKTQQRGNKDLTIIKNERMKECKKVLINSVVDYLNSVCGTSFKVTSQATMSHISGRIDDGFTFDDFKTVIDKKHRHWKGTEWEKYLRPQTLFNREKFESYLNEPDVVRKDKPGKLKAQWDVKKTDLDKLYEL
jgi:uncharacterized phage protein (TIGR02220 family)